MSGAAVVTTACIVAIGDEIVSGLTVDTNSSFLAGELRARGVAVEGILAAPDDDEKIERTLRRALEDAELVIATGGLGPTEDDRTAAVAARVAGVERERSEAVVEAIRSRFRARGRDMPPSNARQADLPVGCTVLENAVGTAPGFLCAVATTPGPRHLACLPGVPGEVRTMVREQLIPWIAERAGGRTFAARVFSTFGLSESELGETLAGVVDPRAGRLAFRAAFPKIQARVTVQGSREEDLGRRLDAIEAAVRRRLGHHLYAVGDVAMEEALGLLLAERGLTLAVAESCTGGLIGDRITDVAGSSRYFTGGVVAYHDETKVGLLGVRRETLAAHGAVSTRTAEEMAEGIRGRSGADLGLATTGIAGPRGGSEEKPVGTVCVALARADGVWSKRYTLGGLDRRRIKELTAQIALNRVRLAVEDHDRAAPDVARRGTPRPGDRT